MTALDTDTVEALGYRGADAGHGLPLRPEGDGYRLAETDTHWIDVMPMLFGNHRVVTTVKALPMTYDRGWCYPNLLAAVAAVAVWDPETEDRPAGWVKEVHTGERPNGERW